MSEEQTARLDEFAEIVDEALEGVARTVRSSFFDRLELCMTRLNEIEVELDRLIDSGTSSDRSD